MKAKEIIDLLAARHTEDVFVPECKGGPTWGEEHHRLDAWAMRKSWSRPLVWGYEVKVSRADFLGDNKWQAYLSFCNDFYFVAPAGVIKPEELPKEVGLLCVASTGRSLFLKKKAPSRQVRIPEEMFRYILMSRAKICRGSVMKEETRADRIASWRERLAIEDEGRTIGWHISRQTADRIEKVTDENARLKADIAALSIFRDRLAELGVDASRRVQDWEVRHKLRELEGEIPEYITRAVRDIEKALPALKELIDAKERPSPKGAA